MTESQRTGNQTQRSGENSQASPLGNVAEISAFLTVVATVVYTVGLAAVIVPLKRDYGLDFSTALYMTSYVPRTFVAGLGITNFFGAPLLTIAIVGVYLALIPTMLGLSNLVATRLLKYLNVYITSWIIFLSLVAGALYVLARLISISLDAYDAYFLPPSNEQVESENVSNVMEGWLTTPIVFVLGGLPWVVWGRKVFQNESLVPRIASRNALWKLVISYFVVISTVSFASTSARAVPLPSIKVAGEQQDEGTLLARSNGYWYLINSTGSMKSIPDDEVKYVCIYDTHDKQPLDENCEPPSGDGGE